MIWKAMFDAACPTWKVYGRAAFVEAVSEAEARDRALVAARADYPEMQRFEIVAIGESTAAAREAFNAKRAQWAEWMARTHPNTCPTCGRTR